MVLVVDEKWRDRGVIGLAIEGNFGNGFVVLAGWRDSYFN